MSFLKNLTKTNKQGIILTMEQQSQTVKDFLANGGTIKKIPTGTKSKKSKVIKTKTDWLSNYVDPHISKNIEQEQLVGYWAKTIGLSKKAIERLDTTTLHALRTSKKLLLGKTKYRDQLTAQFITYLTQFETRAIKGKTTPKDNMAVFRLHKHIRKAYLKAQKQARKQQRTVNS
jgi:hypothetical protein